jgi:hypothetical protein
LQTMTMAQRGSASDRRGLWFCLLSGAAWFTLGS